MIAPRDFDDYDITTIVPTLTETVDEPFDEANVHDDDCDDNNSSDYACAAMMTIDDHFLREKPLFKKEFKAGVFKGRIFIGVWTKHRDVAEGWLTLKTALSDDIANFVTW